MDLTIEFMLVPRGAADWSQSFHGSYRVLTIVAVYWPKSVTEVGMPRTGYIHVTDVPTPQGWAAFSDEEKLRRFNRRFCSARGNGERRVWGVQASSLPAAARNALRLNRQITVTWTQFKNVMQHLDDQRALTDDDLGAD